MLRRRRALHALAGLAGAVVLAGCATPGPGEVFLPRAEALPPGVEEVRLTAALEGRLVIDGQCVRVANALDDGALMTVIWRHSTELGRDRRGWFIREQGQAHKQRFHRHFRFGGGAGNEGAARQHDPQIAARCGPPYVSGWLPDA